MRKIFAYLMFLWLGLMIAQGIGGLNFGTEPMPLVWIGSVGLAFVVFILIDRHYGFKSETFKWLYPFFLFYFMVFNLSIIFDWYSLSPLVNRAEHLLGGVLLTFIAWGLMVEGGVMDKISSKVLQLIFLAGVVALGSIGVELFELSIDVLFEKDSIGPELLDTNWDLLMDMLGLSLVLIIHRLSHVYKNTKLQK